MGNNEYLKHEILHSSVSNVASKKKTVLCLSLYVFLLVIISIVLYIIRKSKYDYKVQEAVSNYYNESNIVESFEFYYNEKCSDVICIVDEINNIDIGFITTFDEGKTFNYVMGIDDIDSKSYYAMQSPTSEYYIKVKLFDVKSEIPSSTNGKIIEICNDGKKAWLCFNNVKFTQNKIE